MHPEESRQLFIRELFAGLSYGPEFMCNDKCVTCNALIHYTFYITLYTITREPLLLWFLIWKIWLPY